MHTPGKSIQDLFTAQGDACTEIRQSAAEIRALIEAVSRDIERHTAAVCTGCSSVCCIHRHSRYDRSDGIFLAALGLDVPEYDSDTEDTAPCRFLGARGCILPRSRRPYRCTWFFCTPLLDHIIGTSGPPDYRRFMRTLRTITEKRTRMIEDFELLQKSPGLDCTTGE
jgi:hypothetical protein